MRDAVVCRLSRLWGTGGVAFALLAGAVLAGAVVVPSPSLGANLLIRIGTSGSEGSSYNAGAALCSLINKAVQGGNNLTCMVEPLEGSLAVLRSLRTGGVTLGIVQSDAEYREVKRGNTNLRSVMALFPEYLQVVVRSEGEIKELNGLKDRTFSAGLSGSGGRITLGEVLDAEGRSWSSFGLLNDLPREKLAKALCDGSIDGYSLVTGMKATTIKETAELCGIRLVPVTGAGIQKEIDTSHHYYNYTIPAGTYAGQDAAVPTLGLLATLVTNGTVADEIIYECVKAVFASLVQFQAKDPVLKELTASQMANLGIIAPLHPGAARFLKEAGHLR